MAKKNKQTEVSNSNIEKLISNKYVVTLHIDNDMILRTEKSTGEFQEFALDPGENWSKEAIAVIGEIEKNGKDNANG